jgi:ankyrin repeat protein
LLILSTDLRSSQVQEDDSSSDAEDAGSDSDDDIDMVDDQSDNADATTENSIIRIDRKQAQEHETLPDDDNKEEPDILDINVLAWDAPVSALHLAIANGHTEVVRVLVQDFGADVLLPIKLVNDFNKSARAAILPLVLALQLSPEKAKDMTKLLMSLGASPAQADVEHFTALQYFAAHGNELLSTMVSANRPAAQRAVDHLCMSGHQYRPTSKSVLQTAIEHGDSSGVDILLELGAKPQIDFGTYITSYKSRWDVTGNAEHNQQQFQQSFQQPVFTAIQCELPSIVLKLLDAGADINSLSTDGWCAVYTRNSYDTRASSLLDVVRAKIAALRAFVETGKDADNMYTFSGNNFPPVPLKDDAEYLDGHDPGSYTYWSITKQLQQAKRNYERDLKGYEERKILQEEPEGTAEKKKAVELVLSEFEYLLAKLTEREAKTFKELYPDIKLREQQQYNYGGYQPEPPKPWSLSLTFQLPDLTDERREGYVRLFQACWDADLATVKELTLTIWGDTQSPLKIAVQDISNFSPYSIAVLRQHFDVARAILEIAHAQYAPDEKKGQTKHSLQPTDDDEERSDNPDDDFQIYTEIVDDRFTVENIGEVQHKVKSNVTPLQMMSWFCPVTHFLEDKDDGSDTPIDPGYHHFGNIWNYGGRSRGRRAPRKILKDAANGRTYYVPQAPTQEHIADVHKPGNLMQFAIFMNDPDLLHFLIAMGEDYTVRKRSEASGETVSKFFRFDDQDFQYAIRLGKVQLLEEIIKRTGAGIPLDDLVKKSGIEIVEKQKYYQGLSVHGKKRADWANAGRDTQCAPSQEQHPPLLHAARLASLESVEWLLSDASARCYSEFANNHRDDERIQNLAKAKGGLDTAISTWLGLRSHLLLHCVVLSKPTEDALQLLRHLCKTHPEALEHRSATGLTPLHLAFSLHRVEMIKILIAAGADQTCRNNVGDNILHSMLCKHNTLNVEKDLPRYREILGLVDTRLLASLFTERTTEDPGAATPLARWLYLHVKAAPYSDQQLEGREQFVQAFLDFSKGEDLGIVNGEGDTAIHAAVRYGADEVLRVMLACRGDLLHRENATGRTPYEMAEDAYLSKEVFSDPPSLNGSNNGYYVNQRQRYMRGRQDYSFGILAKKIRDFVDDKVKDGRSNTEKVWEVCKDFATKTEGSKRKLVSLVEANEVAKRLALRKGSRDVAEETDNAMQKKETEDVKGDEVDVWYDMARSA